MSGGGTFFSSPLLTTNSLSSLPGRRRRYVHQAVEIGPEPTVPVALALHELEETLLLKKVQVALDRPWASGEPPRQGIHARPAQPRLVVRVIRQGTVRGDHLRRDPGEHEVADLGDSRKVRSDRHINLPVVVRRVRSDDLR